MRWAIIGPKQLADRSTTFEINYYTMNDFWTESITPVVIQSSILKNLLQNSPYRPMTIVKRPIPVLHANKPNIS